MTLVIDSSVCVTALIGGLALPADELVAPALFDSEVVAALRRSEWAGIIDAADTDLLVGRLADVGVTRVPQALLRADAIRVARQLGWARTYDAEYVALAQQREAVLVSRDARLRRGAARLVRTADPDEL